MASDETLAATAAPAEGMRLASTDERVGRAALFAAAICMAGVLVYLTGQLGWWAIVAGPAYLAGIAILTALANGRAQAMHAVVLTTGSTCIVVGLMRLAGLA